VLHFGNIGRMMGDTDLVELDKLYQRFVVRDFVNDEYREQQMVKVLRQTFVKELQLKFTQQNLMAGVLDIPMPLVHKGTQGYRVIKPLAFEQKTPLKAYEHGVHWLKRVEKLIEKRVVLKDRALFTVERPANDKTDMIQVYDDVVGEIKQLGVKVDQFADINNILQFAKADIENKTNSNSEQHH
jgi:hypothetical protein